MNVLLLKHLNSHSTDVPHHEIAKISSSRKKNPHANVHWLQKVEKTSLEFVVFVSFVAWYACLK